MIPKAFGKARLGGNVIWMRASTTTVGGGGKGGGGDGITIQKVSFRYYADVAIGLCRRYPPAPKLRAAGETMRAPPPVTS